MRMPSTGAVNNGATSVVVTTVLAVAAITDIVLLVSDCIDGVLEDDCVSVAVAIISIVLTSESSSLSMNIVGDRPVDIVDGVIDGESGVTAIILD